MDTSRIARYRHRRVAALVAVAFVATLGGFASARAADAATTPFTDIAGTTFEADIEWLWAEGITSGCTGTTYCPNASVTRGQMASFLVRMFDLTEGAAIDAFTDDDGTTHEVDINRLAHAGITTGCSATAFCPADPVSRDEMTTFLTRAIPLTAGAGNDYFRDDDGTTHEGNVDRAAAAGIASGCGTGRFCPGNDVSRGQMAGFLHRVDKPVDPPPHPAPKALTLYVKTTGSDGANECLVEATPCRTIHHALGASAPGDTIDVGPGSFVDHVVVRWDITIQGEPALTDIDATPDATSVYRHFWVARGATLVLDGVTLTGGNHRGGGSSIFVDVGATLHVRASAFVGNGLDGSGFYGGAILNAGTTSIEDSVFDDNRGYRGGAIANGWGSPTNQTLTVSGSTFDGNQATDQGGAIWNAATMTVSNSTFVGNAADVGSAIRDSQIATVVNSTITGNVSRKPYGAISIADELALRNSLVIGNAGGDTSGLTAQVASIVGIPAGLTLADILDPDGLQDNGGPTETIALTDSASNPARQSGDAATCAAAPINGLDQRGLPRTPPCDIGAYEHQP